MANARTLHARLRPHFEKHQSGTVSEEEFKTQVTRTIGYFLHEQNLDHDRMYGTGLKIKLNEALSLAMKIGMLFEEFFRVVNPIECPEYALMDFSKAVCKRMREAGLL